VTARKDAIARPTLAIRRAAEAYAAGASVWLEGAVCGGAWHLTDLPTHHARMSPDTLYRMMLPALQMCDRCPFAGMGGECFQKTAPSPYHDGVVGGVVLRNGKPLRLRKIARAA
jgi:hypothetical protein